LCDEKLAQRIKNVEYRFMKRRRATSDDDDDDDDGKDKVCAPLY
jgi:hypothetical protein